MKLATRINSFLKGDTSVLQALREIGSIFGITHVDLNYPEHLDADNLVSVKEVLKEENLLVNGLALRFRDFFRNGELGNRDQAVAKEAVALCKQAMEVTKELGGTQITIWLGYDGFDYPFQLNYAQTWASVVQALREIADYNRTIKVSIEYKPYQPRAYSLIPDTGTTLLLINDVGRDNLGITLDFCHMLMKSENPAYGLDLAGTRGKLFGVHLNDGHHLNDDGLMIGTVNVVQTLEFIYYMKKHKYDGVVYFDTFPTRECPTKECETNIRLFKKYSDLIDMIGMDKIQSIVEANDAIVAQQILFECLR